MGSVPEVLDSPLAVPWLICEGGTPGPEGNEEGAGGAGCIGVGTEAAVIPCDRILGAAGAMTLLVGRGDIAVGDRRSEGFDI